MLHLLRTVIAVCLIAAPVLAEEQPLPDIAGQELTQSAIDAQKQAADQAKTMSIPENIHKEAGEEAAKKVNAVYRSPAFQEKIAREMERLETFIPGKKAPKPENKEGKKSISGTEQIYLFLSGSIPDHTIRNYMADLDTAKEIVVVMYGVVGGIQQKAVMGEWYKQVSRKDPICEDRPEKRCERYDVRIKVRPGLFRQYDITTVPAMVYADGDHEPLQIAGDISIGEMLEKINREAKSPGLESLMSKVKR